MKFLDCLICMKKKHKRSSSQLKTDSYRQLDVKDRVGGPTVPEIPAPPSKPSKPLIQQDHATANNNSDSEYALILTDNQMTESTTGILNENHSNGNYQRIVTDEYETPDAIDEILANTDRKNTDNRVNSTNSDDLYSMPKLKPNKSNNKTSSTTELSINYSADDDSDYEVNNENTIPIKEFDANLIYDENKSQTYDRNNNNTRNAADTVDYYYTTTTPATATAAVATDGTNFYNQKNSSSHYEIVPDYEIITHMTADGNNNISRLNVTQNENTNNSNNNNNNSTNGNIRNIIVNEEVYYSNIDQAPGTATTNTELNTIQYMDNSETVVNNRSTIIQVTTNESIKL